MEVTKVFPVKQEYILIPMYFFAVLKNVPSIHNTLPLTHFPYYTFAFVKSDKALKPMVS